MSITFPTARKDARAQEVVDDVDVGTTNLNGRLNLKDSGDNILSTHDMSDPAFGAVVNGTSVADTIANGTGLLAGAAVSFDVIDRDESCVLSGTVGAMGSVADLESTSSSTTVAIGETVSISALTYMEVS